MSQGNQPIHRIRFGNIGAAIFENRTEDGKTFYNAQFDRSYRVGEEWKNTRSFGKDDLLAHAKLCDSVHTWIHEQLQSRAPSDAASAEE